MFKWQSALIVEDELELAKALVISLQNLQLKTELSSTIKEANKLTQMNTYDLILLDRRLPDGDGIEFCKQLRNRNIESTILMLTASGETCDKVDGLKAGADDYLPKPFSWEELMARVEALARRAQRLNSSNYQNFKHSNWHYDPNSRKLNSPHGSVIVTDIEAKLLLKFLNNPGVVLNKRFLLQEVWGLSWLTQTRTVDWFVSQLRKKIEMDPQNPKHFITLRGEGYRFDP